MALSKDRSAPKDCLAPTRLARLRSDDAWVSGLPADLQTPMSANLIAERWAELTRKGFSSSLSPQEISRAPSDHDVLESALRTILNERFELLCRHYGVDGRVDGYRALAFLLALQFLPGFKVKPRRGRPSKPGAAKAPRSLFNQALRAARKGQKQGRRKDPELAKFDRSLLWAIDEGKRRLKASGVLRPSSTQALERMLLKDLKGRAGKFANDAREARRREKARQESGTQQGKAIEAWLKKK